VAVAIVDLPVRPDFMFLVVGGVDIEVESQQLGIVGLKVVLKRIGIERVFSKSHLQVQAIGEVANLRVALLLVSAMDEDLHTEHLELAVRLTLGGFLGKGR
jgi:hypothetical protein